MSESAGAHQTEVEREVLDEAAPRKVRAAAIREEDIEPYTALRWVSTLFKAGAIFLVVALVGEAIAGLKMGGSAALPILLGEVARTLVFIVVLWGMGDLVRLLIDIGHDIRAQRVLLARTAHRLKEEAEAHGHGHGGEVRGESERGGASGGAREAAASEAGGRASGNRAPGARGASGREGGAREPGVREPGVVT